MSKIEALKLSQARRWASSGEARRIREESCLSLAEMGHAVGVSHVTVRRWERAERKPTGRAALKYADVLAALRGSA